METEPQQIEELKELVRQNIALAQETNQMLHGMRRSAWVARGMKLLWIAAIIVVSYVSYMYLQPYLTQITNLYSKAQSTIQQFQGGGATTSQ